MPIRLRRARFNSLAYQHARVGTVRKKTNGGHGNGHNESTEHITATHQANLLPVSGYPCRLHANAEPA